MIPSLNSSPKTLNTGNAYTEPQKVTANNATQLVDDNYLPVAVRSWLQESKDSKELDRRRETVRPIVTFIKDATKYELWLGGLHLHLTELPPIFPMKFPTSHCELTNQFAQRLTTLYLGDTEVTTLPDSIGNLTNLTFLDLSNNELTTLPKGIKKLTNLRKLNLEDNKLSQLPNGLLSLPKLKRCYINRNRIDWNWSPQERDDPNPIANNHLNNGA